MWWGKKWIQLDISVEEHLKARNWMFCLWFQVNKKKKVLRRIMWPSKCCRCVTESQRWQTSYNATNQNLYSPLHHATHNKINVNLCGLSAQTSLARQKDKKRLMQIIHNWVSTQQAGLGTNVLQVNVSIDVTQWDTGCVLVGRRVGGAS